MGAGILLSVKYVQMYLCFLRACRQLSKFPTSSRATGVVLLAASVALDEEEVAKIIGAVGVRVARSAALMASGDDVGADAFAQALVEDEIFADELVGKILFPHLARVFDNAAF